MKHFHYAASTLAIIIFFMLDGNAQIPSNTPQQVEKQEELLGSEGHRAGTGFSLITTKDGSLAFSAWATVRFLNQKGLEDTFTNSFGRTSNIKERNDLQLQKVVLYFKGWLFSQKFRYVTYVWTANTNQGQGAQVVLGGNFQYSFNKHFDAGVGIGGVPSNRSLIGQWPFWLRQDARTMAEEFFRGSFTTGVWLQGEIVKGLNYKTMLGNNLSQLGVDAGQLDGRFDTWSTSLWWITNNYSQFGSYGDFEYHAKPAIIIGSSFTRSNENRQSQPGEDDPENSQLRLSDGTNIFAVNAFGTNNSITDAKYEMSSFFGGIKYKGFSLDADYFIRWVSKLKTINQQPLPFSDLLDKGVSVQASGMLVKKRLQAYGAWSYVDGQFGKPWEINAGFNWFPFKYRGLRINPEVIFTHNSPVGYFSYPTVVGAKGTIFMLNLEVFY